MDDNGIITKISIEIRTPKTEAETFLVCFMLKVRRKRGICLGTLERLSEVPVRQPG